jgi:hypothetical protein
MSQQDLLRTVVRTLERLNISYMITGSIASSVQGEPRSTHDIDIVVDLPESKVHALVAAFPPQVYRIDQEAFTEAVTTGSIVNLINTESGDKVVFWMLTDDPFDRSRFARRYRAEVLRTQIEVSSPEDTILMKLRWARLAGGSEKHFIDALRVYEVQHKTLDQEYFREWTLKLGIEAEMETLRTQAVTE